jgi:hypothetical protein
MTLLSVLPPRIRFLTLLGCTSLTATTALLSCGGGATNTVSGRDGSYRGMGSTWTATFTAAGAFTISYDQNDDGDTGDATEFTVSGTYIEYTNRFRKLTVTSASGAGAPSVGEQAYGLEIPGFAFFLKPIGTAHGDQPPIPMLVTGTCPTAAFNANWMKVDYASNPGDSDEGFGSASFSFASGNFTPTIEPREFGTGNTTTSNGASPGTCSNGVLTLGGGATMLLTQNGGALVRAGAGEIIFAAPQRSSAWSASQSNGTYSGLVAFDQGATTQVEPAEITLSGTGGTGKRITDVESGAVETDGGVTFSNLTAVGSKGLFRGQLATNGGSPVSGLPLNCTSASVAGETLLACTGAADAAVSGQYPPFFYLGVRR